MALPAMATSGVVNTTGKNRISTGSGRISDPRIPGKCDAMNNLGPFLREANIGIRIIGKGVADVWTVVECVSVPGFGSFSGRRAILDQRAALKSSSLIAPRHSKLQLVIRAIMRLAVAIRKSPSAIEICFPC
jgi:hypothetical protein